MVTSTKGSTSSVVDDGSARAVLERVLGEAERTGSKGVLVFDLDSTLLDNRPRQARILREFGAATGLSALMGARPEHWTSWDIKQAMTHAGLSPEEVERNAEAAKSFWRDRFFTSEYCAGDAAIAGAVAYVAKVVATSAQVAYCTGRHEPMREGSVASFRRLGLPEPGARVHLLMKPTFEQSDDEWKEVAYARLRALGQVLAAFDNEPTHVNGYRRAFPDAIAVHLATDHSGRPVPLDDGIYSVRDFTAVGG
jgi:predicted secreted acid phosphatase